jgi:hypothetical protein
MAANPTLAFLIADARNKSGEPDPTGRWSDARLTELYNRAQIELGITLEWPEATFFFIAQAPPVGQVFSEYYLEEHTNILRVKLGGFPGQNIIPTSIDMLEGTQYALFDDSQTAPPYGAQWLTQAPGSYPITNTPTGYPTPLTLPWSPGNRPAFYLRGAGSVIGFVPAPAVGTLVQLDVIAAPPILINPLDQSCFPNKAIEALTSRVRYYMADADGNNQAMMTQAQAYGGQNGTGGFVGQLLSWKKATPKHKSRAPLFVTARTKFQGPCRVGSGTGRYGN